MPYGSLGAEKLSQASRLCLEKALDWWQKSMHTSKHKTFLVVAGYDSDGMELALRKQITEKALKDSEFSGNVITAQRNQRSNLSAKNLARA